MSKPADWTATDSDDNAESTATKAAVANNQHFVTHLSASFSAAATKLLQLKFGTTVKMEFYVVNSLAIDFDPPIAVDRSAAVSAVLAASGTGGVIGKVNLAGYSK